jgi:phosphonate transport system permease protein
MKKRAGSPRPGSFIVADTAEDADRMTVAVSILPSQQLAALSEAYRKAVARKRLRFTLATAVFFAALIVASIGAEVNLRTLFTYFGHFVSYFDRILTLDDGTRVWTNVPEWLWGWHKWSLLLGETILISYVGTLFGAVLAFALNFLAAENTSPAPWLRFVIKRLLEFCRTVPGIVFALIFVIAFGLGPMAGVLAIALHSIGALAKQYAEMVENIDMKPVEGVRSTGAGWLSCMRFAVLPQVAAGFASYTLLRFEINVREASVMGFVGAGGIGTELVVAVRKFYYSDVSAILLMIVLTVFVIDIGTGWIRERLLGKDRHA